MDHIGIYVHQKESQICMRAEGGNCSRSGSGRHRRASRRARPAPPGPRILLEASTDSEWVARCLERLGHEVIVADHNFAPHVRHPQGQDGPA